MTIIALSAVTTWESLFQTQHPECTLPESYLMRKRVHTIGVSDRGRTAPSRSTTSSMRRDHLCAGPPLPGSRGFTRGRFPRLRSLRPYSFACGCLSISRASPPGGSPGCALVGRLAARSDLRIALIEAGPDYGPLRSGSWPHALIDAHHSPDAHDWGFDQSRARIVGGCSAHNECALVRALPGDYDRCAVPGWKDADLSPLVDELLHVLPARVSRDDELVAWQRAFLDAAILAGAPRRRGSIDPSGATGVGSFTQNIKDGILAYYLNPRSRGRVRLATRDPGEAPIIDLDLLGDSTKHDVHALVEGVRLIHGLTRQKPFADVIKRGPRRFTATSRLVRFIRENTTDYAHPVGTCRMGPSPDAGDVVDHAGRVHGLTNVYVADASIVPVIPRANVNLTCFVIGSRVADLLVR